VGQLAFLLATGRIDNKAAMLYKDALAFIIDMAIYIEEKVMARTDREVVKVLLKLYGENFGGKDEGRFIIRWSDLRGIYGLSRLFESRFLQLVQCASNNRLYLWDLGEAEPGHLVAVIKTATVDRWRRVPEKIAKEYRLSPDDAGEGSLEDDED
jgi:hypothetical protein